MGIGLSEVVVGVGVENCVEVNREPSEKFVVVGGG